MVVKDRITEAFPPIRIEALRVKNLPSGVTTDDLESHAGEALIEAHANFDESSGRPWLGWARLWLRNSLRNFVRQARRRGKRQRPLDVEMPDGTRAPRVDERAVDPGLRASARELVST